MRPVFPMRWLCLVAAVLAASRATQPETTRTESSVREDYAHCKEVVVGAGWAGVYFAYRRAVASAQPAQLCLFESSKRIGGRTYSVRNIVDQFDNSSVRFTVDVGAYRFSPDMHLPGDLIMKHLNLPTRCYEPGCPSPKVDMPPPFIFNYSAPLRRIVDEQTGLPAGYVTAIERMVHEMQTLGATVSMQTELVEVHPAGELTFRDAKGEFTLTPAVALLNLARNRLFGLRHAAQVLPDRAEAALRCIKFDQPPELFHNWTSMGDMHQHTSLSKAYFEYRDAWWLTKLNVSTGEFPENAFFPILTRAGIPIGIRWSDGPTTCRAKGAATACTGFLEAYYSVTNETFFSSLPPSVDEPLGVLQPSDAASRQKLETAHAALMEALGPLLKKKKVSASSIPMPEQVVVGVWHRPDTQHPMGPPGGITAPTKVYYSPEMSGPLGKACGVDGLTEEEYRSLALQPFDSKRIFLANNDWSAIDVKYIFGDWAEETLLQAERALRTLGMEKPSWLDKDYYAEKVAPFATPAGAQLYV